MKRKLLLTGFFLWLAFIAVKYFKRFHINSYGYSGRFYEPGSSPFVLSNFTEITFNNILSVILLLCVVLTAYFLGRKLLAMLRFANNEAVSNILSISLGLVVLSFFLFILGVLGLIDRLPIIIVFILLSILSLFYIKGQKFIFKPAKLLFEEKLLLIVVFCFLTMNFICCLVPETYYDSLVYHLAVPSLYIMDHGIVNVPYNLFANFPQNIDMLYMLGLLLQGGVLAKLINLLLGALCLAALYYFVKENFNRTTALISLVIFYSIPLVSVNQINTQLDIGMTLYVLLSLFCLLEWIKSKKKQTGFLFLSGLFAGFSMGAKYSAVIFFLPLSIIFYNYLMDTGTKKRDILEYSGIFLAAGAVFILPWLVKNLILNGNMFYPYFSDIPGLKGLLAEQRGLVFNNIKDLLLFPWTATMESRLGNWHLGPLLLMLLPVFFTGAVNFKNKNSAVLYLVLFLEISFILWISTTRITRFFIPGIAVYSVITASGIYLLIKRKALLKYACYIFIFAAVIHNFIWISDLHLRNLEPFKLLTGRSSVYEYLSTERPSYPNPYYPAIDFINNRLDKEGKVLFLGETRGFYCNKIFITGSVFDKIPLCEFADNASSLENLIQKFKENNIRYIMLNEREFGRLYMGTKQIYSFGKPIYDELLYKGCKEIFNKDGLIVYEVLI